MIAIRKIFSPTRAYILNSVLSAFGESVTESQIEALESEIRADKLLCRQYESSIPIIRKLSPSKKIRSWDERFSYNSGALLAGVDLFYVLVRILRPSILIETGVAAGSMTAFILSALNKNKHGQLTSFDLPPKTGQGSMDWSLPETLKVGFLIPDEYKSRWSIVADDATYALPAFLRDKKVDYFFHDSDHTYEHMMLEYCLAYKHLDGVLVSDDILLNNAFHEFCRAKKIPYNTHPNNNNLGLTYVRL